MSIFIMGKLESKNRLKVTTKHYRPDTLSDDILKSGYMIKDEPTSQSIEGKVPVMYYNPETGEAFYEYEDRPLTPEEQLKKEINSIKAQNSQVIVALVMGGLM